MTETPDDWTQALQEQNAEEQANADAETQRYGEQVMSDFDNIVEQGNQRRAETRRMKDATLSALILQARKNNGFVPTDVLEAASQNMGFPVAGGNFDRNGNFIVYSMQQDQNGQQKMVPVAVASPEVQFKTLGRAKMGIDYQREIYGNMSRRFTPSQLEKAGVTNPDTSGPVTIGAGTARRVFGFGGTGRSGGGSFSADGKGGFSRMSMDGAGNVTREDFGTRDPNYKGKWKLLSVGADPSDEKFDENGNKIPNTNPRQIRRYENSQTGEVVSVRDGETPPWERSALSEKERIAKANNEAKAELAKANNEAKAERDGANNEARMDLQDEKAKAAAANIERQTEATRYKADAMKRIAEIRAGAKSGGSGSGGGSKGPAYKGKDLKDVASILTNPLADDATKDEARKVLTAIADNMSGGGGGGGGGDVQGTHPSLEDVQNNLVEGYWAEQSTTTNGRINIYDKDGNNVGCIIDGKTFLADGEGNQVKSDDGEAPPWVKTRSGGDAQGAGKTKPKPGEGGKKVSYNDLKPGQTFVAVGKDGSRHRYRKTESGYQRID